MIYLGADHRGFELKEKIKEYLVSKQIVFDDLGNIAYDEKDDYPDYAYAVAKKVAGDNEGLGILICGSGVGVDVVANKIKGIRSGLIFSEKQAKAARADDDVNVVSLPVDFLSEGEALKIVEVCLETGFSNEERFVRRLEKIKEIENE